MKPLLLQSKPPTESSWVRSEDCKGIRFTGADMDDWFKVVLDIKGAPKIIDLNGPRRVIDEVSHTYLFNGDKPRRVKIHYVTGSGPVDVDLI